MTGARVIVRQVADGEIAFAARRRRRAVLAELAGTRADALAKDALKVHLVVVADHAGDLGDRQAGALQQVLGQDHALVFAPAHDVDAHLLAEQVRQSRRRQTDVLGHLLEVDLLGEVLREVLARFLDALQLFTRLVNIGDAKSLATHPASTTHRQLDAQELAKAGVSEGMVRLSIGIEHIDDILADLQLGLKAAANAS